MLKNVFLVVTAAVVTAGMSLAADMSKIPQPLSKAKVGQFAAYNTMGGGEQKQSITAIEGTGDDQVITIKMEITAGGQSQSIEQKIPLKNAKEQQAAAWAASPDIKVTEGKVTVKGKEVSAVIIEFAQQGATSKIYMSDEIPVTGIVKMEMVGMPAPVMEITDYKN